MVLACILVASKVEESIIDMRELRKIHSKMSEEDVLEAENRLLKALKAQLHVHHPHNLLQTYLAVLKRAYAPAEKGKTIDIDAIELDSAAINTWLKLAVDYLDVLYVTPAPLLHAPRDLAVAALIDTEKQVHKYETSLVDKSLLANASDSLKPVVIAAVQAASARSSAYLSEGKACMVGDEVASVGAWVKLSKSGWPKREKSAGKNVAKVKKEPELEPEKSLGDGDGDGDEGGTVSVGGEPPTKRIKMETI